MVTVESGDTSKKTVDMRTPVAEVDEEESVTSKQQCEQQHDPSPPHTTSWFVFSWKCAVHDGMRSPTLMEAHAQFGWLFELVVVSDDARVRECEFVEFLVDTGATEHVCGPHDFTHAALTNGPRPRAQRPRLGELLKHYGTRTVDFRCQGEELQSGLHRLLM